MIISKNIKSDSINSRICNFIDRIADKEGKSIALEKAKEFIRIIPENWAAKIKNITSDIYKFDRSLCIKWRNLGRNETIIIYFELERVVVRMYPEPNFLICNTFVLDSTESIIDILSEYFNKPDKQNNGTNN